MPRPRLRHAALAAALALIVAAIVVLEDPFHAGSTVPARDAGTPQWALAYPAAADFGGGTGWIGSKPLDLVALRGQVVLVDFWTYSCINCIHTFPYLKAWHERYDEAGLVIVGVHTPEFRFERDPENVRTAMERHGLEHAVVQDNDYRIWRAYSNRFWPAKYLLDEWGGIRYTHFGEGAYRETEEQIRTLLAEAGHTLPPATWETGGILADGGFSSPGQTPELFASTLDGRRNHAIGNDEGHQPGQTVQHAAVDIVEPHRIYLGGAWHHASDHVRAVHGNTTVTLAFHAGASNFVAGGPTDACVDVLLDGGPIAAQLAARDVTFGDDGSACVHLDGTRAYSHFAAAEPGDHLLVLTVPAGFELYSFAFSREGRT